MERNDRPPPLSKSVVLAVQGGALVVAAPLVALYRLEMQARRRFLDCVPLLPMQPA